MYPLYWLSSKGGTYQRSYNVGAFCFYDGYGKSIDDLHIELDVRRIFVNLCEIFRRFVYTYLII